MEELKVSIDGIVAATGESRAVINDAVNAGHLKTFLVGRRRFARPAAVSAWIDFLEAESVAGHPVVYRPRTVANSDQVSVGEMPPNGKPAPERSPRRR